MIINTNDGWTITGKLMIEKNGGFGERVSWSM